MSPPKGCAVIYTDGASSGNPGPAGLGIHITYQGHTIEIAKHIGSATNNIAEYSALVVGLREAQHLGATEVQVFMDSELAVKQLNGIYKVKNPGIAPLYNEAISLLRSFKKKSVKHVPREQNKQADRLSKIGTKPKTGTLRTVEPPMNDQPQDTGNEDFHDSGQGTLF